MAPSPIHDIITLALPTSATALLSQELTSPAYIVLQNQVNCSTVQQSSVSGLYQRCVMELSVHDTE